MKNPIVIACKHCLDNGAPVRLVAYTASDRCHQLMCGDGDHDTEDAVTVHFSVLSNPDPSLLQFLDFDPQQDVLAERQDAASDWSITTINVDEA